MKYFLMIALSVLMTGSAAEAHTRDRHRHNTVYTVYTPWFVIERPQPKIRISDHCVYKPWKNKTVCKY